MLGFQAALHADLGIELGLDRTAGLLATGPHLLANMIWLSGRACRPL